MDADGNIWAIVPVKETAAAKQRLAGLLVAGARRQLALAMLADVLQAIAGAPELAGIVAVTVDPDAATSLCAPASRHGARRIAMVTPVRSWPRTCRSRTAKKFEIDKPGMHTTDTVDYGILMEGEISLELDDVKVVALKPGDIVVQNGTRHAWRNSGDGPATLIFVLIGANRSNDVSGL